MMRGGGHQTERHPNTRKWQLIDSTRQDASRLKIHKKGMNKREMYSFSLSAHLILNAGLEFASWIEISDISCNSWALHGIGLVSVSQPVHALMAGPTNVPLFDLPQGEPSVSHLR